VLTSAGSVPVAVPRVNDKRVDPETGERQRFSSAILPPWARKTPRIDEVFPLLYRTCCPAGISCPRLGNFPRLGQGAVVVDDYPVDRDVEGRGPCVRRAGSVGRGLRVAVVATRGRTL
jgi:hypothetical protein